MSVPPTIQDVYPATPSQQGFLLGSLASPDDALFVEQLALPLHGPLDADRLRDALETMIDRHPVLRCAFALNLSDEPRQVVLDRAEVDLELLDARSLGAADREDQLARVLERQRAPFDLSDPPLLRLALQQRSASEHVLVWSHHHAILDGWSQMLLVDELLARHDGREPDGPARHFGEYALWLSAQDPGSARARWSRAFDEFAAPEPLAVAAPGPGSSRFAKAELSLSETEATALERFARDHDTTLASAVIACWGAICAELRETAEVAVGVTVSGRSDDFDGAAGLIGPLVHTVPIRLAVDRGRDLAPWIRRLQRDVADAAAAGAWSGGQIHAWTGQPPDRPLFDSIVALSNYPPPPPPAEDGLVADLTAAWTDGGRTSQPLALVVMPFGGLELRLVSDSTRVPAATAVAALEALRSLLLSLRPGSGSASVGELLDAAHDLTPLSRGATTPAGSVEAERPDPGSVEQITVEAFAEAIGRRPVGLDDDLMALGGHSMIAIGLLADLRGSFAVDLTLRDLATLRTPRAVARKIGELIGSGTTSSDELPTVEPDPVAAGEPFPLTPVQEAYWIGRQPGFELSSVDAQTYVEIDVPDLDLDRLTDAWNRLIARHPMLRAVMLENGRQQVLTTVPRYRIAIADSVEATRARLSHIRRDTTHWPLFDVEALPLPDGHTRLFLSFDLLIGDALSWRVLQSEIAALYEDLDAPLPPLELTFRDYVRALIEMQGSSAWLRSREYWRRRLPSLPPAPTLPGGRGPDELDATLFRRRRVAFGRDRTRALRKLAGGLGVSTSVLVLSTFAEALRAFSANPDMLVNLTVYNRLPLHRQVDRLVGDFTSLLLIAIEHSGGGFAERTRSLQRRLWTDLDHRHYDGTEVLRDLRSHTGQAASAPVVFTSVLDLAAEMPPIPGTVAHAIGQTPQVSLDCQAYEADGRIAISWDSVDELFADGILDAAFTYQSDLLRRLADDPLAASSPRPLPAPAAPEIAEAPLGGQQLLHEPFLDQVRRRPEAIAIVDSRRRLGYAETASLAAAVSRRIDELRPAGPLVGIALEKGWEQVVGVLGVLLAGRAFVPIDPGWPATRIRSVIARTGIELVVSQSRIAAVTELATAVEVVCVDETEAAAAPSTAGAPPSTATATADDTAYVVFTSGSTGEPKGVTIQHKAALNTVLDVNGRFAIGPEDRLLALSSLTFDLSIYDIFGPLSAGGTIVMPDEGERRDPVAWGRLLERERVTVWNSVPVLMSLLVAELDRARAPLPPSLRLCLLSGDWIPLDLPDAIRQYAPLAKVLSLGGATEGSIWSILHEVGEVDPRWQSIPYGRAMTGQAVEVLDADLVARPVGVPGEIYISGHGTAAGYWNDPEQTARSFVHDARTARRLYRTGDWGRLRSDGAIELLGRDDDQVKVGGHRIELREIEAALADVPGVDQAAVVTTGDRFDRRLAAFATGDADEGEIRRALAAALPGYMVPSVVGVLDRLPLSPTGKIDRSELVRQASRATSDAPEQVGADLLQELGGLAARIAGRALAGDADLLEQGLTSIEAIRLLNAVDRRFGVRLDVGSFYASATLVAIAREIESASGGPPASIADSRPSAWTRVPQITDPVDRERFRQARPELPPPPADRLLPLPSTTDATRWQRRRTPRRFSSKTVPRATLGGLLDPLRRIDHGDRRTFLYPSAGGLYSVDVYLAVRPGRVEELEGGIYYYHPDAHDLDRIVGDIDVDSSLHEGIANRVVADTAAFTTLLVTDPANSGPLYGEQAHALNLLNAGYMGQLMCQTALDVGLALCPLHGFRFEAFRWLLPAAEDAVLLHLLAGGVPEPPDRGHA